jgi:transcriptional regulator with XRE-family HTH domain
MSKCDPGSPVVVDWKAVGRRIRELRGFDTKQADLAEAIGAAQSHISAAERGQKELGAVLLLRISRMYGKTLEWLLTGSDDIPE